jgi:glycosyltransferase involved in cell wall biosynthesis
VVFQRAFGAWLGRVLQPADVVHVLSGFGLEAHRVAKQRGSLTVCDRGSAHIAVQDRVLAQEHARWNIPYTPIPAAIVERELAEYELCDLIFVPSSFAAGTFVDEGVAADKIRTVPFGVDAGFTPTPRTDDDAFRVLFAGAISLNKGVGYLLEAAASLTAIPAEVWLMGPRAAETNALLRDIPGNTRYLGMVPRDKLPATMSSGSVFVLPSVSEGLALVIAQAMACGLPVIATPDSGAEELMTDGVEGFIVPACDADALAEKVIELYEKPDLRAQMSRAAMAKIESLGGWERYGNAALAQYMDALGSAG